MTSFSRVHAKTTSLRVRLVGRTCCDAEDEIVRLKDEGVRPICHSVGLDIYPRRIYHWNMAKKSTAHGPLTPAVLHILLALSTGERHGYGIMKQVQADSQGKTKMGPGTLYGSMGRMMEAGLIRESDKRVDPEMDDERRIYYELTGAGRAALEAELNRYRGVVAVAEGRFLHGH